MGAAREYQDLWESLSKNKIIKISIITMSVCIALFFLTLLIKAIKGDHLRIFGIEINFKENNVADKTYKADTLKKPIKVSIDSIKDRKSAVIASQRQAFFLKHHKSPENVKSNLADTVKPNIKYKITAPLFNSAVGDNSSVTNNYTGKQPRILNDAEKLNITLTVNQLMAENKDWDKKLKIHYDIAVQDDEAQDFADQIYSFLKKSGYDQFETHYAFFTGRRYGNFEIKKATDNNKTFISISVFPEKTIQ